MDNPTTIQEIFTEVQTNLYDAKLRWYSSDDILNAIQDQYNKTVAIMRSIESTTFIPQIAEPYYDLRSIPDFMYLVGVYNPATNLWLEGLTYKQMKATYQTYLAIGQPRWLNVVDFTRILLWPYDPAATGVLFIIYKATAPTITLTHTPILPHSVGGRILEYLTTAELMEQAREFTKAKKWFDRTFKPQAGNIKSIWEQCKSEVSDLARMDRERVLEPYRWIFHGGSMPMAAGWVCNEIPSGTINSINPNFTLAQVPNPSNSLLLMKNGQVMFSGIAFTLSGANIAFNSGYIPQGGTDPDVLRAWYEVG